MISEKLIAIGCDDTNIMTKLLKSLNSKSNFINTIVSAVRLVDITNISKNLSPDLIILCFKSNQIALKDLFKVVDKPKTPILCLSNGDESEILHWEHGNIVFEFPIENILKGNYLQAQIQSIFTLSNASTSYSKILPQNPTPVNNHSENGTLSRYVMELDQKVETLLKVKERITYLYPRVDDPTRIELSTIVNSIRTSINDTKLWDDFKLYFERTHPDFLLLLAKKHPELTNKDLKYCCYLKMNMTNNDIRNLLGINQESVRTHKFRLKKKMALPKNLDIVKYLRSVA